MASSRRGRSRSRRNGEWEGGYLRCHDSGGGGGAEAVGEAFSGTKNGSFRAPPGGVFARAGSAIGGTSKVRPHRRHFAFLPENSSFRLKALPHPGQSQLIMVSWPPQNLWRRFRVRLRALRRTGQLKRKRASNQGRSSNPRQGAKKTAPGRRPLAGARHKHCFSCVSLNGPSWRFWRKQFLTLARHSSCLCDRSGGHSLIWWFPLTSGLYSFQATQEFRRRALRPMEAILQVDEPFSTSETGLPCHQSAGEKPLCDSGRLGQRP
jgi:hypothetical protein